MTEANGPTGGEPTYVEVMRTGGEYRIVSRRFVPSGSRLFKIDGVVTDLPSKYSVQVGRAAHVDLPGAHGLEELMNRFYWRFTNHSCEPNALIRGRDFLALRPIEPGQEITFHYNTTEYELAEPFDCRCGSDRCQTRIRGFRFLSRLEQERLRPWLADHLLSRLEDGALTPSRTAAGHDH